MAPALAAYDRARVGQLLRSWTTGQLRGELRSGSFGAGLAPRDIAQLDELLAAWEQRALGAMPLRDALMVDSAYGPQVYALICSALTRERVAVRADLAALLPAAPADLAELPPTLVADPALAAMAERAALAGLVLAWQIRPDSYPPPDLRVLQAPPPPFRSPAPIFHPPSGRRRSLAAALATFGVVLLIMPLLVGHIPESPAGLPLALLTLALMIGIRAGLAGLLGAGCIWLVANLPGFRHGMAPNALWPALPLLLIGVLLLCLDPHVRAMWAWISHRLRGSKPG